MTGSKPTAEKADALRVDLDTLEIGTHPRSVELDPSWLAEVLAQTDARVDEGGTAELELTLQADRTVLVRGQLGLRYSVPCARCLEPAVVDVGSETEELCVTYVPAERLRSWAEFTGKPEDEDEIEPLDPAELDEIGYEGSTIDLRALLAEQALLAYPMRALCSEGEACLGLCMRCGTELNGARSPAGEPPDKCPSCGLVFSGEGGAEAPSEDSPWKKALSKVKLDGDGN